MKTVKDSDILKEAKKRLENRSTYRVCFAINEAARHLTGEYISGKSLINWVEHMLRPHYCFEDWVIEYRPELAAELGVTFYIHADALRPIRIQWLDWMIAYCEKEEENEGNSV